MMKLMSVGGQIINLAHLVHATFGDVNGDEWARLYMAVPDGASDGGEVDVRPYRIDLSNQDAYAIRHYLLGVAEKINDTLLEAHHESPF